MRSKSIPVLFSPKSLKDDFNLWVIFEIWSKSFSLNANFSSLKYKDKDLIGYWKKFPQLKIWASLDAMGDTAEVIRKGTDWERIVKNMRAIKEQVPHAQFQITPTISIWNVFHFPDFFDYMIDNIYGS